MSNNFGISKGVFISGIIIAVLLSTVISLGLSMQFAVGPQGQTGLQGPTGATGPQGVAGPQGQMGPQGATGPIGPQGQTGLTGETGPQGPQGEQGIQGPKGDTGDIGPMGPAGGFGDPDYDSDWIPLTIDDFTLFTHNLGQEDNLFVYLYGRYYDQGYWWYIQDSYWVSWVTLDEHTIGVFRLSEDTQYEQGRLLIWKIEDTNPLF